MAQNSFELDTDHKTLIDISDGKRVVVGTLEFVPVKYLFEWAGTNTHKAWVRSRGISEYEMEETLEAPGQSAGKGYYVSTDPIDSIGFGTAITVYKVRRALLILTVVPDNNWNATLATTEEPTPLQSSPLQSFSNNESGQPTQTPQFLRHPRLFQRS